MTHSAPAKGGESAEMRDFQGAAPAPPCRFSPRFFTFGAEK